MESDRHWEAQWVPLSLNLEILDWRKGHHHIGEVLWEIHEALSYNRGRILEWIQLVLWGYLEMKALNQHAWLENYSGVLFRLEWDGRLKERVVGYLNNSVLVVQSHWLSWDSFRSKLPLVEEGQFFERREIAHFKPFVVYHAVNFELLEQRQSFYFERFEQGVQFKRVKRAQTLELTLLKAGDWEVA